LKLIEALEVFNQPAEPDSSPPNYFLACGFEPLHLRTFLGAHLRLRVKQKVEILTGVFGDLAGNLGRAQKAAVAGCAVVIEWSDLDPRLGQREAANWIPENLPDIVSTARAALARLASAIGDLTRSTHVVVSLPTLPLPPIVGAIALAGGLALLFMNGQKAQ